MLPYEYAKLIVQAEGIESKEDYLRFVELNELEASLPLQPWVNYREWVGWSEFLGIADAADVAAGYRASLMHRLTAEGAENYRKRKRGASFWV